MKTLTYASACDGIGSVHCAWHPLGMRCAWTSEIEPFPSAVVEHHWHLPNLGDMTKIKERDYEQHGPIDVFVAGTPCQSFSVAGLRGGLDDPRGNLCLRFLQLAGTIRPRWVVWENVPGVLSSWSDEEGGDGGKRWQRNDFDTFLSGLGKLGYGFAWAIRDAQFFGVPQRRRRVFVVGYLGDWRRAVAVLFERHSLSGNPPPFRCEGEGVADGIADSLTKCRAGSPDEERGTNNMICSPLMSGSGHKAGHNARSGHCKDSHIIPVTSPAMNARDYKGPSSDGDGDGLPLIVGALPSYHTANGHGMSGVNDQAVAAWHVVGFAQNQRNEVREMPIAGALAGEPGMKQQTYAATAFGVRRLTPRECERLQGFPDDYTAIQYRGKLAADGPRYKALGNSMAVPCMQWIGERILKVEALCST